MLIKADIHRSGGTQPSVLLLKNIISTTHAMRKTQGETKRDGRRVERGRQKSEVHFNQGFGPLSCDANVHVCLGGWHNFADGFDPLSTVT